MQRTLKNILVPADFSASGNSAIKIAIQLCKQHQAVLHLIYVIENRYIVSNTDPDIQVSEFINEMNQKARARLYKKYESILEIHHIDVEIHIPIGIPYDEICKAASENLIDLIVIGTHGASGTRNSGMGTTTYGVIKNSIKPVLTIPPTFKTLKFKKILFPIRPVEGVKAKYEFLNIFLKNMDAAIHFATLCMEDEENDDLVFNSKEELLEFLALQKKSNFSGIRNLHVCRNYAAKVLELSEILAVDLVVINSTLYYKWANFFVGPFTQQVVNYSKMPVLCLRQAFDIYNDHSKQRKKQAKLNEASSMVQ